MKLLRFLAEKSGFDIREAKYSYGIDPVLGFTSASKHADRWVNSTCGYCSVGCGMQFGVRDNRVVSVRGNPQHPVNLGKLCPKGLAEHYAIEAEGRARQPLLRKNDLLSPVTWDKAIDTLVERFRTIQRRVRTGVTRRDQHGAIGNRRVLRTGKARAVRLRHAQL